MTEIKKQVPSLPLPSPPGIIVQIINAIFEKIKTLKPSSFNRLEGISVERLSPRVELSKFNINKKNIFRIAISVLLFLVILLAVFGVFGKKPETSGINTSSIPSTKILATASINKEFKFPLKDEKGQEAGQFAYTIESAELRNQIVVKGQAATAVPGRVFLLINLKLNNSLDRGLSINTRDYIRVSVNGNDKEWFAPDIHNDPVEAQAISTKNTRVGIAINENDRNIRLQIGEIDGKKEIIPIAFKD